MAPPDPGPASLAIVAGASGTIGAAAAGTLATAGLAVIGTYRQRRPAPMPGVTWVPFDGAGGQRAAELRGALAADPRPLTAVISCIGAPSSKQRIADTGPDEFDAVFTANVTSVVRLWQAVCPRARAAAAGVVLLGSDTTATLGAGNGPYSAAKAGLEALTVTLAAEEAEHGVRVNLVAPSLVASPLAEHVLALKGVTDVQDYYRALPWGRPLSAAEVAAAAVEIATAPHWRYASGQVLRLAAGFRNPSPRPQPGRGRAGAV
jgi:NAD(P)-dependent dehydrogenase (short-subunit alcohol dehydrogenase family)